MGCQVIFRFRPIKHLNYSKNIKTKTKIWKIIDHRNHMYRMNGPETKYIYICKHWQQIMVPGPTIHVTTSKAPPFCLKIWRKKIQRMPKMFIVIMNRRRFVTKSNMWRLSSTANSLWKSEQHLHIFNGNEITNKKNERDMRKSCITWLGVRKSRLRSLFYFFLSTKQERDLESGKNPKPGKQKRARHFQNPMRRIRKETCER